MMRLRLEGRSVRVVSEDLCEMEVGELEEAGGGGSKVIVSRCIF